MQRRRSSLNETYIGTSSTKGMNEHYCRRGCIKMSEAEKVGDMTRRVFSGHSSSCMHELTKIVKAHTRPTKVQLEQIPAQRGELGPKLLATNSCWEKLSLKCVVSQKETMPW